MRTVDPRIHPVDTLSQAREADFTVTHVTVRLPKGKHGQPREREAFFSYLDGVMRASPAAPAGPPLPFDVAFLRLLDEQPAACLAITLCHVEGLTERVAAAEIRVCPALVNRRKWRGLGQLAAWTGRPAEEVALLLEDLGRPTRAAWPWRRPPRGYTRFTPFTSGRGIAINGTDLYGRRFLPEKERSLDCNRGVKG